MKIFVSSLIGGMKDQRAVARRAIKQLGHEPIMAEDFPAQASSPQVACLSGVREADAVVLILGKEYGAKQASGLSATHEEYREARNCSQVLLFIQDGIVRTDNQENFLKEVESWDAGTYRKTFSTPGDLHDRMVHAIHQWELSLARTPLDEKGDARAGSRAHS